MTTSKALMIGSFMLLAGPAQAAAFDAAELGLKGLTVKAGEGRINGHDLPVSSIAGFATADGLFAKLKETCKDRCTVTREATDVSQVFVVADVFSDMCARCTRMWPWNIGKIMASAYTISVFDTGEAPSFAIGAPTGKLLDQLREDGALAYEGDLLKKIAPVFTLKGQSRFAFNGARTDSLTGVADADLSVTEGLLVADLERAGYARFAASGLPKHDAQEIRGDAAQDANGNVWVKGQSALRYQLSPLDGGRSTMVELYEVAAP